MEIAGPHFEINETVEPTPDAAIKPAGRVGRVESRAWTEFRGQPGYWRYTIRWPGGGTSSESAKHLQPADAIACDLKVVVSGAPIKLETTTTATVAELIEQALLKSGIATHEGAVKWELRTADGKQLTHLVGDAEPVDGETTLFLDPEVGGGGERPFDEPGHMVRQLYTTDDLEWKGTPPAQGTRRALIRDAIADVGLEARARSDSGDFSLFLADAVEAALPKEVGDRRDATIKGLKAEVDRLLEGRESARLGEDQFKAQRDAALHLLRWLIGDLIPSHLVDLTDEENESGSGR